MNVKKIVKCILILCLFLGVGTVFYGSGTVSAQEKIVYTMEKGSSRLITKLLGSHPFTKNETAKYRNLIWWQKRKENYIFADIIRKRKKWCPFV